MGGRAAVSWKRHRPAAIVSDADARTRLAYHEAGHVVVSLAVGRRVQIVTIDPLVTGRFAFAAPVSGDGSPESLRHDLRIFVAGDLAEGMARPDPGMGVVFQTDPDDPDSIYMSPLEANLAAQLERAITKRPQQQDPDPGVSRPPLYDSDAEAVETIARQLDPDDPASEILLATELAGRALVVHTPLLRDLAHALLAWRTLDEATILAIRNTLTEGAARP